MQRLIAGMVAVVLMLGALVLSAPSAQADYLDAPVGVRHPVGNGLTRVIINPVQPNVVVVRFDGVRGVQRKDGLWTIVKRNRPLTNGKYVHIWLMTSSGTRWHGWITTPQVKP